MFMKSMQSIPSAYYYSGKGQLSIYGKKSFSRQPIILGVPIKSSLNHDGSFSISLVGKDFFFESSTARQNLRYGFGIGFSAFNELEFFNGSVMDDFNFKDLTQSLSTFIVGGDLISLHKSKKVSFIGNLKMIDGLIYLNTTFTLSNTVSEQSDQAPREFGSKCNLIELMVETQLAIADS
tara:strand:+ start:3082 stop:3618 length:537 start_codon:yes stop_codon:yes gene_type:complete